MRKILTILLLIMTLYVYAVDLSSKNINVYYRGHCDKILEYPQQLRCYNYNARETILAIYNIDSRASNSYRKRLSFRIDKNIPNVYNQSLKCYKRSGYDRGHIASDASFDYDYYTLKTTYLTSNIIPQTIRVNRYLYKKSEMEERKYAELNATIVVAIRLGNSRLKNNRSCPIIPYKICKVIITPKKSIIYVFNNYKNTYIRKVTYEDDISVSDCNLNISIIR